MAAIFDRERQQFGVECFRKEKGRNGSTGNLSCKLGFLGEFIHRVPPSKKLGDKYLDS
jgi:hypothetical protein